MMERAGIEPATSELLPTAAGTIRIIRFGFASRATSTRH
jgi:hypothetical protein